MYVDIIPIGNSRGIRIPSSVLKQCGLTDHVQLTVENGKIILERPVARAGWSEAFERLASEEAEELLLPEHSLTRFDSEDWDW